MRKNTYSCTYIVQTYIRQHVDIEMFNIADACKPGFTSFKKFCKVCPVCCVFVGFIF